MQGIFEGEVYKIDICRLKSSLSNFLFSILVKEQPKFNFIKVFIITCGGGISEGACSRGAFLMGG